jgi:hypothetical protein
VSDYKLLAYVAKEINKLRSERIDFIAANRASSFDDYRHVCGVIRGLSLAETILNDLVQKMEKSDD